MDRFILQEQKDMFNVIDSETGKVLESYSGKNIDREFVISKVDKMNQNPLSFLLKRYYMSTKFSGISSVEKTELEEEINSLIDNKNG